MIYQRKSSNHIEDRRIAGLPIARDPEPIGPMAFRLFGWFVLIVIVGGNLIELAAR